MKCDECNGSGQIHKKIEPDKKITMPPNYISAGTIEKCNKCNGTGEVAE